MQLVKPILLLKDSLSFPYWLGRLDEICYGTMPREVAEQVKMLPSEYFKRQCWVSFELGEPCLCQMVEIISADQLLYGSDFPYSDHLQFSLNDFASDVCALTPDELRLALEKNPKVFFGT